MPYYAVKVGNNPGIYKTWSECESNIKGYDKPVYKKFEKENDAIDFLGKTYKKQVIISNLLETYKKSKEDELKLIKSQIPVNEQVVEDNYDFVNCVNIYTYGICLNIDEDDLVNLDSIGSIGIYFGDNDKRNISKKIVGNKDNKMTKSRAELKSVLVGISKVIDEVVENNLKVVIHTDSYYSIRCFTTDTLANRKSKDIMNYDYIEKGYNIISQYPNIKFHYQKHDLNSSSIHSIKLGISKKLCSNSLICELEDIKFKFGKYKNSSFSEVYEHDSDYFDWCLLNSQGQINEIKLFMESKN